MKPGSRILGSRTTQFLILVTIVSKLIGFVREMMLLGSVGISTSLDIFVLFFGFSTFVAGVVGTLVVTNLTPVVAEFKDGRQVLSVLVEATKVSAGLTVLLMTWNYGYVWLVLSDVDAERLAHGIVILMGAILFLSVIAEYQVALFLGRGQQTPVISGNIIISLPLVIGMLFFEVSIWSYSVGLALAFLLRVIAFTWLLRPELTLDRAWWQGQARSRPIVLRNFGRILQGGSAMLAVNVVFMLATMIAERQSVGAATLVSYGRKIPMLVLTSVWFVLGSRFFSDIVRSKGQGSRKMIARLVRLNSLIMAALCALALAAVGLAAAFGNRLSPTVIDFARVVSASIPLLPIVVFVPIIEMSQRTLVTQNRHAHVVYTAIACLGASALFLAAAAFMGGSATILMLMVSLSLLVGAVPAYLTATRSEAGSAHE